MSGRNNGKIRQCYTTCDVTVTGSKAGGISGTNESPSSSSAIIQSCYATGKIIGNGEVGGILGCDYQTNDQVEWCVAMNSEVTARTGTAVGRILGYKSGILTNNNYARSTGMTVKSNNVTLTTLTPTPSFSNIHGESVTAANTHGANSATWWTTAVGFTNENWSLAANRLPHLKTTTSGAFNQTQTPTVN